MSRIPNDHSSLSSDTHALLSCVFDGVSYSDNISTDMRNRRLLTARAMLELNSRLSKFAHARLSMPDPADPNYEREMGRLEATKGIQQGIFDIVKELIPQAKQ